MDGTVVLYVKCGGVNVPVKLTVSVWPSTHAQAQREEDTYTAKTCIVPNKHSTPKGEGTRPSKRGTFWCGWRKEVVVAEVLEARAENSLQCGKRRFTQSCRLRPSQV
jgi:hypothetical protein